MSALMRMVQTPFAAVASMTCSTKTRHMNVSFDVDGTDSVCCCGLYDLQHQDQEHECQL